MVEIADDYIEIENCRAERLLGNVRRIVDAGLVQPDATGKRVAELQSMTERVEDVFRHAREESRNG